MTKFNEQPFFMSQQEIKKLSFDESHTLLTKDFTLDEKMEDFSNHPFFIKKKKDAIAFLKKHHPLPNNEAGKTPESSNSKSIN